MPIPVTDNVEIPINNLGLERNPHNVIVKNTLWVIYKVPNKIAIKEYTGNYQVLDLYPSAFFVTQALKSDRTYRTDRFWLFAVVNGSLILKEIEPFTNAAPVIHIDRLLDTNVINVSCYVKENDYIRVIALYDTLPNKTLKALTYDTIDDLTPSYTTLSWANTRPDDFSNYVMESFTLEIVYTDIGSPPVVYITSYTIPIPSPISAIQVGFTLNINVSWGVSAGSDQYILERADNPSFTSSSVVYTGNFTSTIDTVTSEGPWYYRVKAQVTTLALESFWSDTAIVTLVLLNCDFSGTPTSGGVPLSVQFTDLSTGEPTSWDWNFGDGSPNGTTQNPLHIYTDPGTYTVVLTVTRGISSSSKTRTNYITVNTVPPVANFTADQTSGDYPLVVQFTDTTVCPHALVEWLWNFGDGYTSTEQNPIHVYNVAGTYTVSLYVKNEFNQSDIETKTDYISVSNMFLIVDFVGVPRSGISPLVVDFTNQTTLPPGHTSVTWLWDFGDGTESNEENPSHIYLSGGKYTVTLKAFVYL